MIYVNDNFGEWRSHHGELLDHALAGPHARLVEPIKPDSDSLFVLKTRHSIFFETPLEYLLRQQGLTRLVLVGQVTEQCVLYSALDATSATSTWSYPRTRSRTSTRTSPARRCG